MQVLPLLPLLFAAMASAGMSRAVGKPDILLIVADDQGYAQIGYHNQTMLMPRINEIARAGVILESYYVQPICSPTRSSLMTGRYTYRLGTQATVIRADVPFGVPLTETFLSQNMGDAGYHTALFGKVSRERPALACSLRLWPCCSPLAGWLTDW
jgi:arylsulfatase A-like enzyme